MNTTTNPRARAAALLARTPTATLVTSLRMLAATPHPDAEHRMVHAWTIEELERRYPAASAAVEAAFDADEVKLAAGIDTPGVDYVAVLLAAIPAGA